jgi:hypothetical protein
MADREKDLVHLFVRDLDDIELPPRDRWRPTRKKESYLVKTSKFVLSAAAVAAVLILALLASFVLRDQNDVAATPSPTSTTNTASPTASAPAGATGSPSASPLSGRYASPGLAYSIETPPPWHRTTCEPTLVTQPAGPVVEVFVPVSARDEMSTDIGSPYTTLRVFVEANPQSLSPRQWAEQDRTISGRIEDIVYADRPAVRNAVAGTSLFTYFAASGGRMYKVDPLVRTPLDAETERALIRMIDSFRFLSEAEQAAARAALRTPPLSPRTPEQVADGVAAAMAAKDVNALAGFLSLCVITGGEQAGGVTVSREKYLDDLRAAFAAGLVVDVRPRPLEERAPGFLTAGATWQDARGAKERQLMLRRVEDDRWEWVGTIERF